MRGIADREMRKNNFRIVLVTTFIDSSDFLPISASRTPVLVRYHQKLRETSRSRAPRGGCFRAGFAPLRYQRRTPR